MAHLTCQKHRRRSMVIRQSPKKGYDLGIVIHRNDGTRCEKSLVSLEGRLRTASEIVLMRVPLSEMQKAVRVNENPVELKPEYFRWNGPKIIYEIKDEGLV